MKKIILTLIIITLFSCNSLTLIDNKDTTAKIQKLKADKRLSYFIYDSSEKKTYVLSEPSPDVILEKTTNITNSLGLKNTTGDTMSTNQKIELANKAIALGEKTVAVNILRDALYRLNEMNVNNRNKPMDTISYKLFEQIVNASMLVALAEKIKQEKELINAKIENRKELEKVSANKNYQKGIKMILDKDEKNSINHFKNMYKDYPNYFNIEEINKKLIDLSKEGMNDNKWTELYKDIVKDKLWRIEEKLQQELKEKIKKQ